MAPLPEIESEHFRVLSVREEVARLRASASFRGGAEVMLEVLDTALTNLSGAFGDFVGTDAEIRSASGYGRAASDIHRALKFIQGADEEHAPSSLIEPVETLARQYMPECRLLVRGAFEGGLTGYWCEFFVPHLRHLLSEFPGGQELAERLIGVVSVVFPSAERRNLLMHAILGHELGHAFSDAFEMADRLDEPVPQEAQQLLSGRSDEERELFARAAVKWRDELLADAWGVHIMGPAYYFACDASIRRIPSCESHPSGTFRLNWLRQQLEARGYLAGATDVGKWLAASIGSVTLDPLRYASESVFAAVEASLEGIREDLFGAVAERWAEKAFKPRDLCETSVELANRLCNLVPPDDAPGKTVRLPDVLNAGWLVRLRRWDEFCEALGAQDCSEARFEALSKLNGLLLKGLEYLAVRKHWEEALANQKAAQ